MGLLDEARGRTTKHAGPGCSVSKQCVAHPSLADEIMACLKDKSVPIVAVEDTFLNNGIDISGNTIGRHRLNQCLTCRQAGVQF